MEGVENKCHRSHGDRGAVLGSADDEDSARKLLRAGVRSPSLALFTQRPEGAWSRWKFKVTAYPHRVQHHEACLLLRWCYKMDIVIH